MLDIDGTEVEVGDLVYWRENKHGAFMEVGKIIRIRESLNLFVVHSANGRYQHEVMKSYRNVRKMPEDRAMLWKLENA